jgi:hypothetical protein
VILLRSLAWPEKNPSGTRHVRRQEDRRSERGHATNVHKLRNCEHRKEEEVKAELTTASIGARTK